jgi:predicted site-specific integrase-resolvase
VTNPTELPKWRTIGLFIKCYDTVHLLRFGADLVFRLCHSFGVEVVVVEGCDSRFEDRLVQDVLELMTVFSAKLYGARSHKRRAASAAASAPC